MNGLTTKKEPSCIFYQDGVAVGTLDWEGGIFKFEGEADESAKIFFKLLKKYLETDPAVEKNQGGIK